MVLVFLGALYLFVHARLTALGRVNTLWVFRDLRVRPIG